MLAMIVSLASTCRAQIIFNPGNGHAYEVVTVYTDWTSAKNAATLQTPPARYMQGHLATFTDMSEWHFVRDGLGSALAFIWFGFTDEIVEGEWRWIDATPGIWQDNDNFGAPIQTAYTDWRSASNEPNNQGNEDYGVLSQVLVAPSTEWNDLPHLPNTVFGYLVEYEPMPMVETQIPTVSQWGLIFFFLLFLAASPIVFRKIREVKSA